MAQFLRDIPQGRVFGIVTGSTGTGGVATATFPDLDCQMACFQGGRSNTGYATVTSSSGSLTRGLTMAAGEFSPWFPAENLSEFYYIMSSTVDTLKYCIIT